MRTLPDHAVSEIEKQQALELILHSKTFSRADQLRKFLRYICEMEEAGRADEITEYSIATDALGRPRSYSPSADSGVRGRAHDLRSKLEQFYESEHRTARVRISVRKGSYAPLFYLVEPQEELLPITAEPPLLPISLPAKPKYVIVRNLLLNLSLVAVAVLVTCALLSHPAALDPVVAKFWGPLVRPGADVVLCLATPPSLLIKPYAKQPNPDIFRAMVPDGSSWFARLKMPEVAGKPYMYFSGNSPLFGDAEAAAFAVRVLATGGASFDFIPEDTTEAAALRNHNVLLIGSPNYSAYAARVLKDMPFTIVEDSAVGEEVIREQNGDPKTKKVFIPRRNEAGSLVLVYGLITVFQNQPLSDKHSRTIIVSGVTGAGSGAAMHFFTSANSLRILLDRLQKDGRKDVPDTYQVVVRGTRDKAVPLAWELTDYTVVNRGRP